jgi:hypothetical protein
LQALPRGADPRQQDLYALGPRAIGGRAGDLVIWHQALPHGASPTAARGRAWCNTSTCSDAGRGT